MATAKKPPLSVRVRMYMAKHPNATTKQISAATGAAPSYIYVIKTDMKKRVEKTKAEIAKMLPEVKLEDPKVDSVNHPAHYKVGGIETIDFIEAKKLNYHLGNVVKYITRADYKGNQVEDLHKARWYLNREIARLEGAK